MVETLEVGKIRVGGGERSKGYGRDDAWGWGGDLGGGSSASSQIERSSSGGVKPHTAVIPDPEVTAKPKRRNYTAGYKLDILKQADACTKPGQLGALLHREGLYHSNLTPVGGASANKAL